MWIYCFLLLQNSRFLCKIYIGNCSLEISSVTVDEGSEIAYTFMGISGLDKIIIGQFVYSTSSNGNIISNSEIGKRPIITCMCFNKINSQTFLILSI